MRVALAVAAGSALGAAARHLLSLAMLGWLAPGFAWGTLAANGAGAFLIGLYAERMARRPAAPVRDAFVVPGFCAGFTTFSIFSLETVRLVEAGRPGLAGLQVLASLAVWLIAVWLGHAAARATPGDRARWGEGRRRP